MPQKNVAYRVTFPILDADGDLVTGATGLDSEVSKDGGTFADCTNEATEIATNSGVYYLDLTSTEMNADTVAVIVKTSTSGAKTTVLVMYPEEAGDIRVNVTAISDDSTAADNAEAAFDGTGYNVGGGSVVAASVTGNVGGNVTGSVGSLATQAKADVNAEVVDCLNVDTYAEPGQGAPAATASIVTKLGFIFKAFRNKVTQTSTAYSLFADDATTVDQKATVSDDGTTFTRSELASGP